MATTGLLVQVKKEDSELHSSLHNCDECDFTSSYDLHIESHIKSHNQNAKFMCFQCTFSSDAVSTLYRHLKNHHRNLGLKTEVESNQERKMSLRSVSAPSEGAATHQLEHNEERAHRSHKCSECEFTSKNRNDMRAHKKMHEWNKKHKCPRCSYSSDTKGVVGKHLVNYHREMADSQLEKPNEQQEEPLVGSGGCHHCHVCDFSTNSSVDLRDHEKTHRRFTQFNCAHCILAFNTKDELWAHSKLHREGTFASTSKERRSESPTIKKENGVELKVEKSEKITPKSRGRKSYTCCSCDYRIDSSSQMRKHEMCHHRRNQKYKCRRCTYSSNNNKAVRFHMNCHHLDGSTSEKKMKFGLVPLKKTDIKSEPGLCSSSKSGSRRTARYPGKNVRNTFALRECSVVLVDVFASSNKPTSSSSKVPTESRMKDGERKSPELQKLETEEAECCKVIGQIEEAIHLDHLKMEQLQKMQRKQSKEMAEEEKKVHLLEIRVGAMKEKVERADEDLQAISSKKDDVQKKIAEIVCSKTLVEYNLRTQQCEALKMSLSALDSDEIDLDHQTEFGGEEIKKLEDELKQMDDDLSALKEEQENLETAEESHVGAVQVLEALVLELDQLKKRILKALEGEENIREQMSQLTAMLEERAGTLKQLEDRLQNIKNLKESTFINPEVN